MLTRIEDGKVIVLTAEEEAAERARWAAEEELSIGEHRRARYEAIAGEAAERIAAVVPGDEVTDQMRAMLDGLAKALGVVYQATAKLGAGQALTQADKDKLQALGAQLQQQNQAAAIRQAAREAVPALKAAGANGGKSAEERRAEIDAVKVTWP